MWELVWQSSRVAVDRAGPLAWTPSLDGPRLAGRHLPTQTNPRPRAGHDRHTPPQTGGSCSGSRSAQATAGAEVSTSGGPARYEIRVEGAILDSRWAAWFGGLHIEEIKRRPSSQARWPISPRCMVC